VGVYEPRRLGNGVGRMGAHQVRLLEVQMVAWLWMVWDAIVKGFYWVVKHPKVAAAGAAVLAFLALVTQLKWAKKKVAKLEMEKRRAGVEHSADLNTAQAEQVEGKIQEVSGDIASKEAEAGAAATSAGTEADTRQQAKFPKKWPTRR